MRTSKLSWLTSVANIVSPCLDAHFDRLIIREGGMSEEFQQIKAACHEIDRRAKKEKDDVMNGKAFSFSALLKIHWLAVQASAKMYRLYKAAPSYWHSGKDFVVAMQYVDDLACFSGHLVPKKDCEYKPCMLLR